LIEEIERVVLSQLKTRAGFSENDLRRIVEDSTSRLGECVYYGLKIDVMSGVLLRQRWLTRNPPIHLQQMII
jgi:hypothetical protein